MALLKEVGTGRVHPSSYSRDFQARAAEDLSSLPDGSAIAEMLSDYAVMRNQARMCSRP